MAEDLIDGWLPRWWIEGDRGWRIYVSAPPGLHGLWCAHAEWGPPLPGGRSEDEPDFILVVRRVTRSETLQALRALIEAQPRWKHIARFDYAEAPVTTPAPRS